MKNKTTPSQRARSGAPATAKRTILLAGGAIIGAFVAATASSSVVSLLYPQRAVPATLAATQPNSVSPPLQIVPRAAHAAVPEAWQIDVTPLDLPTTEPAPAPSLAAAPAAPAIVPMEPAPAALPAPGGDLVIATKSAPTLAVPAPEPAEPAPGVVSARAQTAPAQRPDPGASATPNAEIAVAPADIPRIRPAARPDDLPVVQVAATISDLTGTIPNLRPQPRPDALVPVAAGTQTAGRTTARSDICGPQLARSIPRRSAGAPAGTAYFAALGSLSGTARDARVVEELAKGNVPDFLRNLQPVTLRGQDARGLDAEIVICVTPDYLALGSNRDFVRVPLGLPAAARVAGRFNMFLPTPRMVDAIYAQADVKLAPAPMQPGPQMSSTSYLLRHNATIEGQLRGRDGLVAGQKKDVVMASRMASAPGRVAIYGWHRSATSPIQPVSTVHGKNYADYSHGIRLVSKTAYLNGRAVDLDELLGSGRYAYLLNKEGPLPGPVIRTASR